MRATAPVQTHHSHIYCIVRCPLFPPPRPTRTRRDPELTADREIDCARDPPQRRLRVENLQMAWPAARASASVPARDLRIRGSRYLCISARL